MFSRGNIGQYGYTGQGNYILSLVIEFRIQNLEFRKLGIKIMGSSKLDCFRLRLRDDGIRNRHRGIDPRSPDKAGDSGESRNDAAFLL
jgi:hypothetical protein